MMKCEDVIPELWQPSCNGEGSRAKAGLSLVKIPVSSEAALGPPISAAAKSLQSCPTLCDPIDGIPPGSPIAGILQARTLEWVAISFSNV